MKKHVTHIKKIEYTPSDGFHFIRRLTHEFLKTRNELSFTEIRINSIVESDFVGERFICTDDEEVRAFLEFYESQKEGVVVHVFLKNDFKDFVEIPKDEYERDLILFSKVVTTSNKARMMLNKPIKDNTVDDEIDKKFEWAQKELDDMINRLDKSHDKLNEL